MVEMDVNALKTELKSLSPEDQNQLAAFLSVLRMKREGVFNEIEETLSNNDREQWVSWKTAKEELNLNDE